MKHIHSLLFLISLGFCNPSYSQTQKATFTITNPSSFERKEEIVAIGWTDVLAKHPSIDTTNFKVINANTKKEIPWQLEYRGEKTVQNLLVQINVAAKGNIQLLLQKGKATPVAAKTYGRYVPERKDDFAWENDKIAFRMYGKALELTPKEMAYGIDVWVKSTDRMVINERYKRGKYHDDMGDGMDYYHVGYTLGAGNVMPCINNSIYYSRNYVAWKMLDNGPLRTTFQLEYDPWNVNGLMVKATKIVSLDAGSQLSRMEARYEYAKNTDLPLVVGIIRRKDPGKMWLDEQQGIMGYWEPEIAQDGITGVGTILFTPAMKMRLNNEQLLMHTSTNAQKMLVYYTGAAWNKAKVFTNAESWFDYLQTYKEKLLQPLTVAK